MLCTTRTFSHTASDRSSIANRNVKVLILPIQKLIIRCNVYTQNQPKKIVDQIIGGVEKK